MNPDSKRTNLEPSKEFVKELETKEVLGAPTPTQPSPFEAAPTPNQAVAADTSVAPVKPAEPVLDTVSHHSSRPLEAPAEPKEAEIKQEQAFKKAGMLIMIFSVLAFLWGAWSSFNEISLLANRATLDASTSLQTYVPAALGIIGIIASIGMFFKKSVARIVYLAVAFGYLCLAGYYIFVLIRFITMFGGPWYSIFSMNFAEEPGRTITLYLIVGLVSFIFLFNRRIRAAFWR